MGRLLVCLVFRVRVADLVFLGVWVCGRVVA